ncbi:DUF1904 family protein [Thermoactinomyces mirandus]|uniref:DUF1904 family protein n=1 Tax=Thermoactinomyces mirandus TaxID=2756294 RepID=A0A7W2ARW4_9BACL|nr:DUF1904 family protein [Thermoactinomyces mirandus]MBA4602827.1 DUF1904 family protein [Thermoactinomyces mirandus]
MPYLRFKGFPKHALERLAPQIVTHFANMAQVSEEKVKIELLSVEPITHSPRSLEIMMFPRSKKIHDRLAEKLNQLLNENGFKNTHIFFILLSPSLYYKNGQSLEEIPSPPFSLLSP